MDRFGASFEIKAVQPAQRVIEGYAAAWALDRVGDVIDRTAFDETLRAKAPAAIAVHIAHQMTQLPVGTPLEIRADDYGLFTKTRVFKTNAGDDLLSTAAELLAAGQPLGMSIGFRVPEGGAKTERLNGRAVRRLSKVDLVEYSFASAATIANPAALTVAVKTEDGMDDSKATWSGSYISSLPDSAFAYIEPGGVKDEEGKTTPRSLRHFPHHDAEGKLDLAHLRNALSRAPQSPHGTKALAHLKRHAGSAGVGENAGKTDDAHDPVWERGAPAGLLLASHRLFHLAEEAADEQKAMTRLGIDTKAGRRMQAGMRRQLQEVIDSLTALAKWAEYADRDEEGKAAAEYNRRRLALEEVSLWPT